MRRWRPNRRRDSAEFLSVKLRRLEKNRQKELSPGATISGKRRNALVFFSALFLLTVGALITYRTVFLLLDAQRWVAHSHDVQSALANVAPVIARASRARREFIESGSPAQLSEYHTLAADALQSVAMLRQLTGDNPLQQSYCDRLEQMVRERLAIMQQSIDQKQHGESTLESEAQTTQALAHVASEMDSLSLQMQQLEEQLLSERRSKSQALFRQEIVLITAAFLVAVLLLSLHYYLLSRELGRRQRAEDSLRRLNVRLLEMQDSERRRVSRELHESIGQYLSGVKMSLEVVRKSIPQNALLAECVTILDKSIEETRSISQLLHPPMLDEIGFASAARWYVDSFSERSGVRVAMDFPETFGRLPAEVELALFRVLQESLTSLHWRARSPRIEIAVRVTAGAVEMNLQSDGKIAPRPGEGDNHEYTELGLGIEGIRERVRELGGQLKVQSDETGTRILTSLPVAGFTGAYTPTRGGDQPLANQMNQERASEER